MKTSKRWMMMAAMLMILAALAGCSRAAGMVGDAQDPVVSMIPEMTGAHENAPAVTPMPTGDGQSALDAGASSGPSASFTTQPIDWKQDYAQVENRLNMISEIEKACVLTYEDMALVGVTFDGAYRGEMTQRIQDMVAGEVKAADPAIQTVGVTSEEADVARIQELAGQVRSGGAPDDLKTQMDAILRNATTMK